MSTDTTDSSRNPLEELAEEFMDRGRRGEQPTVDEYVERFPQLADQIRDLFPTLAMMERLGTEPLDEATRNEADAAFVVEKLGDYRIIREVGRGGMGVVYEAEQESLGRRVALKVMLPRARIDPRHLVRFERESRAAARLHHTNIVPVYGVGHQDGLRYFVMQFIDGHGLDQVLVDLRRLRDGEVSDLEDAAPLSHTAQQLLSRSAARDSSTSTRLVSASLSSSDSGRVGSGSGVASHSDSGVHYFRTVAGLGIQAAEALDYANSQGVLHRDVKPSNLLLDASGTLWVTDFGLAKEADADDLTLTGDVVGTLRFMAPERFQNECTARSDIYGLGLTLYELLTMQPAFQEADRATLIARVMNESPPRPRKLVREIPRDLETIVLKAISREPSRRYASAGELSADLRRFLEDRPIHARRITRPERLWRWCRRNPAIAALTLATVALVAIAGTVGAIGYRNTLDALNVANEARQAEAHALTEANRRAAEAESSSALAEAALAEAASAVEEYFTTVSESRLLDEPGLQPLRRELLSSALAYYERLIKLHDGKPELRFELATAHIRAGQVHSLLGDVVEATSQHTAGLELLSQLRDEERENTRSTTWLVRAHRGLAHLFRQDDRRSEAIDHLDRAIAILEDDASRSEEDDASIELALTVAQRGAIYTEQNELTQGVRDCAEAVEILMQVAKPSIRLDAAFAEAFMRLGDAHANPDLGLFNNSFGPYEQAIRYHRKVLDARPRDLLHRDQLADALRSLSRAKFAHRDVPGAIVLLEEALEVSRQLHHENPNVATYHRNLIATHERLAIVYGRVEELFKAADQFRKAISLQQDLVKWHPEVKSNQRRLGQLYLSLLSQEQLAGLKDEAEATLARAIESAEQLVSDGGEDAAPLVTARLLGEIGAMQRMKGDLTAARPRYREAIEITEALLLESKDSLEYRVMLAQLNSDLGGVEGMDDKLSAAVDAFSKAIQEFEAILKTDSQHRKGRHGLYLAQYGRGMAHYYLEDYKRSAADWDRAALLAPAEYTSFTAHWQGFVRVRSGDHRGAALAAEQLQAGGAVGFYYKAPDAAAIYKYQAAQILSLAAEAVRRDEDLTSKDRDQAATSYAERAMQLLTAAANEGLFDDPGRRRSLDEYSALSTLRERADFRQLVSELPTPSADAIAPPPPPRLYWPPSHVARAPK